MRAAGRLRIAACLIPVLLPISSTRAQAVSAELEHIQWPLVDIVMLPDSASVWIVVGPTPATEQWESGSELVDVSVDPIVALQWVTLARRMTETRVTPPLASRHGRRFVLLALNSKTTSEEERFVFVAADSGSKTSWKTFASSAHVESLLGALERAAMASRVKAERLGGSSIADPEPDSPVRVVHQPMPRYPAKLWMRGRIGRVWMTYVVGPNGRALEDSFRPLLADDSLFSQAAVKALLESRFKPARSKNQPVPQRVFQAIVFKIR